MVFLLLTFSCFSPLPPASLVAMNSFLRWKVTPVVINPSTLIRPYLFSVGNNFTHPKRYSNFGFWLLLIAEMACSPYQRKSLRGASPSTNSLLDSLILLLALTKLGPEECLGRVVVIFMYILVYNGDGVITFLPLSCFLPGLFILMTFINSWYALALELRLNHTLSLVSCVPLLWQYLQVCTNAHGIIWTVLTLIAMEELILCNLSSSPYTLLCILGGLTRCYFTELVTGSFTYSEAGSITLWFQSTFLHQWLCTSQQGGGNSARVWLPSVPSYQGCDPYRV